VLDFAAIVNELARTEVLIVDCQTTGASPAHGAVLEVGWGLARADAAPVEQLNAHWVTLPPGCSVGGRVRQLTGYHEAEASAALSPEEAWRRMRGVTGDAPVPTAIHFARFELAFLRDWAARFEPERQFPLDAVCVHAIACRLYPDLPRRSIRALAGYLGHGVDLTRRCRGHVEATAFIWRKLTAALAPLGVDTWARLRDWLAAPAPATPRSGRRRYPLPSARYRALPDQPGVYRFLRSNGDVLYVGKAASLRKRVASHFGARSGPHERALEMLTQVHDVDVTPTPTPLEAALLEDEQIKTLHPPYNVQLVVADPRTWFSSPDFATATPAPDEVHRRGPLPSTFSVRALAAIQALASGESPTRSLRARAVGAPTSWAPDEEVFAAGFATFALGHALPAAASPEAQRCALVAAAKRVILAARSAPASPDEDGATVTEPDGWDPERVVRHLERAVAHAYQLLQRARWLCLLHDSAVLFQEPTSDRPRVLVLRDGRVQESRDHAADLPVPSEFRHRSLRDRQASFDRTRYDHLRTLTTELKRVLRDGGTATVRVGRARWLRQGTLEALLLWV